MAASVQNRQSPHSRDSVLSGEAMVDFLMTLMRMGREESVMGMEVLKRRAGFPPYVGQPVRKHRGGGAA